MDKQHKSAPLRANSDLFRADVPITQDPDYPELIRELADVVEQQLVEVGIEPDSAGAVAESCAEAVRERFGGQVLYWAKGDTMRLRKRRMEMWQAFTGTNHNALAKQFGLCPQQIYRQLAIAKAEHIARTQGSLFGDDGQPKADAA